ncbi:rod shape-determining protein RodA [Flavobacterium sp. '19STA2R22 D10 B1']|uniref:rod shape-determining protein RodA n=1 Tax=Flavobacterium aerium TaxID=3037261 RepID=UPI00278BE5B4|nr:rod shape-determining protein RodA [Flavobacterium sp. '19STA2R22 D10 B1']
MKNQSVTNNIDWISILIYITLVILGWVNIYSASLPLEQTSVFDFSQIYGKQLILIILCIPLVFFILALDGKFYERFASVIYGVALVALAGLFIFGKTIKGQTNWYVFGSFSIQPSEFAKAATALALAKYLSDVQVNLSKLNDQIKAFVVIGLPILLILGQPDAGSAMIFFIFVFVLYREGLPIFYLWVGFIAILLFIASLIFEPVFIILAILLITLLVYFRTRKPFRNPILTVILFVVMSAFVFSVDYVFDHLQAHQQDRINVLLGKKVDLKGAGYNTNQSEIAIGSGGWTGKGFLEGTQTKGDFVPEQHTDYIFTTVGEEWGFAGSLAVIALFVTLILRIIYLAENQKTKFSRVYGYCVASILFIHFAVNIAMVSGIFPTIGVPLPFFSYGGSGLWAFTILLFIFIKMDANKVNEW